MSTGTSTLAVPQIVSFPFVNHLRGKFVALESKGRARIAYEGAANTIVESPENPMQGLKHDDSIIIVVRTEWREESRDFKGNAIAAGKRQIVQDIMTEQAFDELYQTPAHFARLKAIEEKAQAEAAELDRLVEERIAKRNGTKPAAETTTATGPAGRMQASGK